MTHCASALRAFLPDFQFPVAIYRERGDEISEYATEKRLRQYLTAGIITGHGPKHRIKRLRFTVNDRQKMALLAMAKPDHVQRLPCAGEALRLYIDMRRKYRRSGLPKVSKCVTLMEGGRVCEETITRVD